jgi:hypothetical protein
MTENIQKNYEELKKKSELTEKFIKLANKLQLDEKDIPKTEKGMESKVKELMERLEKKLEKEEIVEEKKKAGKRIRKNYYIKKKK